MTASASELRLRAIPGLPEIRPGDDLARAVGAAADRAGIALREGVLVVCQKVVSKAEGRLVRLGEVAPSGRARVLARQLGKDPRQVELVLRESRRIVRCGHGVLITETRHGFVCANAGVDLSNAPTEDTAVLLPVDPDASARRLRDGLLAAGHGPLGVVVSDTFGRAWREGLLDLAIGCAGLDPLRDLRGRLDRRGRPLEVTRPATADQAAAAAGILMDKARGTPAVFVEGLRPEGDGSARELLRDPALDLFR